MAVVHRDTLLATWLPRLRTLYTTDPRLAQPIPLAGRPARLARLRVTKVVTDSVLTEVARFDGCRLQLQRTMPPGSSRLWKN